MPICEFPIAVRHRQRLNDEVKEEVYFIDIVAFSKVVERSKSFVQGAQVLVDGSLSQRRWKRRKVSRAAKYEVIATTVQFLSRNSPSSAESEKGGDPLS